MTSLRGTRKNNIKSSEYNSLLKQVIKLQTENNILRKEVDVLVKNLSRLSSSQAEFAVLQNFLVEQTANTHELVVEIDKLLHPKNYLKYDLTNEPYN